MSAEELLQEAMKLPEGDRVTLADGLLASVTPLDDPEWEAAWVAEAIRRADEFRASGATAEEWRVSLARIRERLAPREPA